MWACGLPIFTGSLNSAVAERAIVVVLTPSKDVNELFTVCDTVTCNWLGFTPFATVVAEVGYPLLFTATSAVDVADGATPLKLLGMNTTPASAPASAARCVF